MIRRVAWILGAVFVPLGIAFASSAALMSSARSDVREVLDKSVQERRGDVRAALDAALKRMEKAAGAAASVPGLQSHLQYGSDRDTILDGLNTEDWWAEPRERFPVSGFIVVRPHIEALLGMPSSALAPAELVQSAQETGRASAVVILAGKPYLAAAAQVRVTGASATGVVLLARPLDAAALESLARASGGALQIVAAGKPIEVAGPSLEKERLVAVAGRSTNHWIEGADSTWAAGAEPLAEETTLQFYASASAEALGNLLSSRRMGRMIYGAGALVTLVALALGLALFGPRKAAKAVAAPPAEPLTPPVSEPAPAEPMERTLASVRSSSNANGNGRTNGSGGGAADSEPPRPSEIRASTPSRLMLAPGAGLNADRVFGPYYLLDKLATGGMGDVYAAVAFGAEGFKRIFVVKRLREELCENPEIVAQFINEARLGASLVHSNIIPIFDFGKVGDDYYLAEEYILGRNLETIARRCMERRDKAIPTELALYMVQETLKALAYAHSRTDESAAPMGLVHRDISPANIMISIRGEVKLLDFGIAKLRGRTDQTRHGVIKGNLGYMAPEQARGFTVDPRTDLFSLGLVLFRCLAGRPLYTPADLPQLLRKAGEGPNEEDWRRVWSLPDPCPHLLAKALQADPAMRFGSAEEFGSALPPLPRSMAAAWAELVGELFGEELRKEQQQIHAAISSASQAEASVG